MPNDPINPQLSTVLQNAFGGRQPSSEAQQPTPVPTSPETSGTGSSLWDILKGYVLPQSPFKPNQGDGSTPTGKYTK